ncbi:50S ribosomal protein L6 [Candidatus Parcubacteria bacterium]|nr:50S ribosomal protein L6 [Candidatus Parcubacteria bacterium]
MSRLGKQKLKIPEKTEVKKDGVFVAVKGPLGELTREFRDDIEISVSEGEITLTPKRNDIASRALWGAYAAHLKNMMTGVNARYEKKLILEGVGYKSEVQGTSLNLALGFSHPVKMPIPAGLTVKAEKNLITISGIDKDLVGMFAAKVRAMKKPEPYKGKGFRYEGEVIRRKQGKKSA